MASVLIVEDEPSILSSYAYVLNKKGYDVTPVESAKQALEKLQEKQFDVIILDLLMPEMSGLDFLKHANPKVTMPQVKILVVSNTESPRIIEEAKTLGADDYYLKVDNTPTQLADRIAAALHLPTE